VLDDVHERELRADLGRRPRALARRLLDAARPFVESDGGERAVAQHEHPEVGVETLAHEGGVALDVYAFDVGGSDHGLDGLAAAAIRLVLVIRNSGAPPAPAWRRRERRR